MKKFWALTLAVFAVYAGVTYKTVNVVQAQGTSLSYAITDDTGIAMLVRYVGSNTSATVAVDAGTGDLTFQVGGSAVTTFECPVSGALGGIIDVSNAACDTMGEVVDTINGNCSTCTAPGDFRAVLVDSLRSDTSTDAIVTIGATQVTRTDGLQLNIDTSTVFLDSRALVPNRTNIAGYLGGPPNYPLLENPFGGLQANVRYYSVTSTYGSGTSLVSFVAVKPSNKSAGSETTRNLYGPQAAGATTVAANFDFLTAPLQARRGEKILARTVNSAAMASTAGFVTGNLQ
jgi:hypothetical protein